MIPADGSIECGVGGEPIPLHGLCEEKERRGVGGFMRSEVVDPRQGWEREMRRGGHALEPARVEEAVVGGAAPDIIFGDGDEDGGVVGVEEPVGEGGEIGRGSDWSFSAKPTDEHPGEVGVWAGRGGIKGPLYGNAQRNELRPRLSEASAGDPGGAVGDAEEVQGEFLVLGQEYGHERRGLREGQDDNDGGDDDNTGDDDLFPGRGVVAREGCWRGGRGADGITVVVDGGGIGLEAEALATTGVDVVVAVWIPARRGLPTVGIGDGHFGLPLDWAIAGAGDGNPRVWRAVGLGRELDRGRERGSVWSEGVRDACGRAVSLDDLLVLGEGERCSASEDEGSKGWLEVLRGSSAEGLELGGGELD